MLGKRAKIFLAVIVAISVIALVPNNTMADDTTPPQVMAKGQTGTGVSITSSIFAFFNEAMNMSTLEPCFNITPYVPGVFEISSTAIVYYPSENLQTGTTYNVTLNGSIAMDLANNTLDGNENGIEEGSPADDYSWEFTTEGVDTTPPKILTHFPSMPTDVAVSTIITAKFTEWMNETSVENAFNITPFVTGLFFFSANPMEKRMVFTPDNSLDFSTTYNVTLNGSIAKDLADNDLDGNNNGASEGSPIDDYSWEFTTEAEFTEPPIVTSADPTGIGVSVSTDIEITFNHSMNWTSVEDAIGISPPVTGQVTTGMYNYIFNPDTDLSQGVTYTVTIDSSIAMDAADFLLDGNENGIEEGSPADDYEWSFTTELESDLPTITSNSPMGTGVLISTNITILFNESMNVTSVESAFNITPYTNGSFVWNSSSNLTFVPSADLAYETVYNVTINSSLAKDVAENLLDGNENGAAQGSPTDDYTWTFTTEIAPDTTPPTVESSTPTGTNVPITTSISITFSEPINQSSVESAFSMSPPVSGSFSWGGNVFMFTPFSNLTHSTTYTITVNGSLARDLVNNTLDGNDNGTAEGTPIDDYVWSFTTEPDTIPPSAVDDLAAERGNNDGEVMIYWTTTGDDGNFGTATSYDIRYSLSPITESNWNDTINVTGEESPVIAGSTQGMTVGGLAPGRLYYFAMKVSDEIPNVSPLSNVASSIAKDLTPPEAPADIDLTDQDNGILVEWETSSDFDLHHYSVYRSTDNVTYTRIGNVTGLTSYLDDNVVNNTIYYYKVTAVDNETNESPFSPTREIVRNPVVVEPSKDLTLYIVIFIVVIILIVLVILLKGKQIKPADKKTKVEEEVAPKETDETGA